MFLKLCRKLVPHPEYYIIWGKRGGPAVLLDYFSPDCPQTPCFEGCEGGLGWLTVAVASLVCYHALWLTSLWDFIRGYDIDF